MHCTLIPDLNTQLSGMKNSITRRCVCKKDSFLISGVPCTSNN